MVARLLPFFPIVNNLNTKNATAYIFTKKICSGWPPNILIDIAIAKKEIFFLFLSRINSSVVPSNTGNIMSTFDVQYCNRIIGPLSMNIIAAVKDGCFLKQRTRMNQ